MVIRKPKLLYTLGAITSEDKYGIVFDIVWYMIYVYDIYEFYYVYLLLGISYI